MHNVQQAANFLGAAACALRGDRDGARLLLGDDHSDMLACHAAGCIGYVTGLLDGFDNPAAGVDFINIHAHHNGGDAAVALLEGVALCLGDHIDEIVDHIDTITRATDAAWQIAGVLAATLHWQAIELDVATDDWSGHLCRAAARDA